MVSLGLSQAHRRARRCQTTALNEVRSRCSARRGANNVSNVIGLQECVEEPGHVLVHGCKEAHDVVMVKDAEPAGS